MSLFNELKRRNVFRAGAAYIVVAWLIMQVADVILNNIEAPGWIFHVILLLLAIGLPLVLVFAWAFELTPQGLKREHEVDPAQSITPRTGRKLDLMIIGVLALALGYFAYDKFVLDPSRDAELVQAVKVQVAAEPGVAAESGKSIAVLPFADLSQEKDQDYFSDGLSEELLNLLAKVPKLRVAARTSSFQFKGKSGDISAIGDKLKVAHVLEGSVRKVGDRIRITTQLIKADDGYHVWSETYERTLDDIFAIQDDIAAEVVEQLKITLLGDAPTATETDPRAYALYLQARHLSRQATTESMEQAARLYEQSLAIAPDYAAAWEGLAANYTGQTDEGLRPFKEGYALAREAAEKALAIDPGYAMAHARLGWIAMLSENDLAAAARHYQHALQLDPVNPEILSQVSVFTQSLGRLNDAIAIGEFALARDPVNPNGHFYLGTAYLCAGRPDDALAAYRTSQALSPESIGTQYGIGLSLLTKGELAPALAAMQQESFDAYRLLGLVIAHHALGQAEESDAALSELIAMHEQGWAYNIAYVLAYRDEADRAFAWLDKAVEFNDPGLAEIVTENLFANIRQDPRWQAFLQRIGKSEQQLSAISFQAKLPG